MTTVVTGKNAVMVFSGSTFDEDDCHQSGALNDSMQEVIFQCNGLDQSSFGTRSVTFSVSFALSGSDTAKLSTLTPGTNSTQLLVYPNGTTSGDIKISSTDANLHTANLNWAPNSIVTVDCTFRLNNVTIGAV